MFLSLSRPTVGSEHKPFVGFLCESYEEVLPDRLFWHFLNRQVCYKSSDVAGHGQTVIDYIKVRKDFVPVLISHSNNSKNGIFKPLIYVHGGPRNTPPIIEPAYLRIMKQEGYTIYSPMYSGGSLRSEYPDPDFDKAVAEVRALLKKLDRGSVRVVGVSAGASIATAVCSRICKHRPLLLAPLLRPPVEQFSQVVRSPPLPCWSSPRHGQEKVVCPSDWRDANLSFYGKYRIWSLSDFVRGFRSSPKPYAIISRSDANVWDEYYFDNAVRAGVDFSISTYAGHTSIGVDQDSQDLITAELNSSL